MPLENNEAAPSEAPTTPKKRTPPNKSHPRFCELREKITKLEAHLAEAHNRMAYYHDFIHGTGKIEEYMIWLAKNKKMSASTIRDIKNAYAHARKMKKKKR